MLKRRLREAGLPDIYSPHSSTTIDLCLSLFPWAQFRRRKSAVKLHRSATHRSGCHAITHVAIPSIPQHTW